MFVSFAVILIDVFIIVFIILTVSTMEDYDGFVFLSMSKLVEPAGSDTQS